MPAVPLVLTGRKPELLSIEGDTLSAKLMRRRRDRRSAIALGADANT